MAIDVNSINDFDAPFSLNYPRTKTNSTCYVRSRTLPCVQSSISAAARRCIHRICSNLRNVIRNASNVLLEVATNQIIIQAEQVQICAESQALMNSTNAATSSFSLRLQDLERTLGRVTHNVHFMLHRLNDWKNDINPNTCSDGLLDLRAATVDIVRDAAYIVHDGNESEGDFNL